MYELQCMEMEENDRGGHLVDDLDNDEHQTKSVNNEEDKDEIEIVKALADFCAKDDSQLSFESGQVLSVLCKTNGNWWWARKGNRTGYIPTNHITTEVTDSTPTPDWQDEEYFGSYSMLKLQQEMLSDEARNDAYQKAIEKNRTFIEGKTVLDVGCGTGLLSMLCVKYGGAKKVYSIEASDMAELARRLIEHNNLSDRITVYQSKIEGTVLPEKVDLIISEWMGTLLIFEFMIESILIARNKWLKDDGKMWPSHARLFLAPTSAPKQQERIEFWDSVCGLDYSCLRADTMSEYFARPLIKDGLNPNHLLAPPRGFFTFDLSTLAVEDLEVTKGEYSFTVTKAGIFHGFASWFSVDFAPLSDDDDGTGCVVLDTGPLSPLTHWKQALFVLDEWVEVECGDTIRGSITMERSFVWRRHLKARLTGKVHCKNSGKEQIFNKSFGVWR